ncbi:hypothetical protein P7C70_g1250, partial [Phenoliferia sp. Uapishka_3]
MTIVDPSHPKAHMAFSRSGSGSHDDAEPPPVYAAAPSSSSGATEPLFDHPFDGSNQIIASNSRSEGAGAQTNAAPPAFTPEALSDLNPEVSKKLAREARESGHEVGDYGFDPVPGGRLSAGEHLPTFAEGDVRPTYSIDSTGNIVSHDAALNSSPLALLRFLRLHCSSPPTVTIHIRGSHTEKRTETIMENHNGRQRARTETRDVEVEDFSFWIDAGDFVEQGLGKARRGGGGLKGVMYEVGGWEAAHRGGPWRVRERRAGEEDQPACWGRRRHSGIRLPIEREEEEGKSEPSRWKKPGMRELRKLDYLRRERDSRGFPGFVHPESLVDMDEDSRPEAARETHPALLYHSHLCDLVETHSSVPFALSGVSSANENLSRERDARDDQVRAVVEEYCSSQKMLKELRVEKEVYGWNWRLLEAGIRATIDQTRYIGTVQIQFKTTPSTLSQPEKREHASSVTKLYGNVLRRRVPLNRRLGALSLSLINHYDPSASQAPIPIFSKLSVTDINTQGEFKDALKDAGDSPAVFQYFDHADSSSEMSAMQKAFKEFASSDENKGILFFSVGSKELAKKHGVAAKPTYHVYVNKTMPDKFAEYIGFDALALRKMIGWFQTPRILTSLNQLNFALADSHVTLIGFGHNSGAFKIAPYFKEFAHSKQFKTIRFYFAGWYSETDYSAEIYKACGLDPAHSDPVFQVYREGPPNFAGDCADRYDGTDEYKLKVRFWAFLMYKQL